LHYNCIHTIHIYMDNLVYDSLRASSEVHVFQNFLGRYDKPIDALF
jgi:hypothetical protein